MPQFIEQLGQQLGGGAAQGALGMGMGLIMEGHNDRRQIRQQQKLTDMQIAGNKQMMDYQKEKDFQMWKDTNYSAQIEELKKAGLNPGLLYGMGGAGGATTGGGSGGVSTGEAPKGGGEQLAAMGISMQAAQLSLLKAQRENIEADTANKQGDAANKPLVGENIKADTALKEINWNLAAIQEHIQGKSQNMQIAAIQTELRKATEELEILEQQKKITKETSSATIERIKTDLANAVLQGELTKAQTEASKKGMEKMAEEIEKIKTETQNIKDYYELDDFVEKKKLELMNKGINVALISATIGSLLNFIPRLKR